MMAQDVGDGHQRCLRGQFGPFGLQRGDGGITDAAGHDTAERRQIVHNVERHPVHRHAAGYSHSNRGYLAVVPGSAAHPYPAAARDALTGDTPVVTGADECILQTTHVGHDVHRVGQTNDWVGHHLAGPVPSDAPASVNLDDRLPRGREIRRLGAGASGVHVRVFKQYDRWRALTGDHTFVELPLELPPLLVVDQTFAEAQLHQHRSHIPSVGQRVGHNGRMTAPAPREVDIVFVHGVSGPPPGWQPALLDSLRRWWPRWTQRDEPTLRLRTIRYDAHFRTEGLAGTTTAHLGARGEVPSAHAAVPARTRRVRRERIQRAVAQAGTRGQSRVGLPPPVVGEWLLRIPGAGMDQARAYRHDPHVADGVRATVARALSAGTGYRVVIGHSLGSIVTLEALAAHRLPVDLLITIGSPLGADPGWRRDAIRPDSFSLTHAGAWLNVANVRDPIAWGRGVSQFYPDAVDAFISAGTRPIGSGGVHDPATYLNSDVVGSSLAASLSVLRSRPRA